MKIVVDLSMTTCRRMLSGTSAPPGALTASNLSLDFTSGIHRIDPGSAPLSDILTATRASAATYVDATGAIRMAAVDEARVNHHVWKDGAWRRRMLIESQSTNLVLGSATLATQNVTVASGWYTLHFTGTGTVTLTGAFSGSLAGTGTGEENRVSLSFLATAGTLALTVTGDVINAQLEAGPKSSYIPTTTSQATRAADMVQIDAGVWPFAATGFSVAMKGEVSYVDRDTPLEFVFYDAQLNAVNFVQASVSSTAVRTGQPRFFQRSSETGQQLVSGANDYLSPGASVPFSIAARHAPANFNAAAGGVVLTANTTPSVLADLSAVPFKLAPSGVISLETLRIWRLPLTDTQLEEVSV